VTSTYHWNEAVETVTKRQVWLKTTGTRLDALVALLRSVGSSLECYLASA
jgi:uncharacterized protein involved in tolerance to divalent cations